MVSSNGSQLPEAAWTERYQKGYADGYAKGKAEVEAVHLRIIAALVEQLGGKASVSDAALVREDVVVRNWRDEAESAWVFSVR